MNERELTTNQKGVARFTDYPLDPERFWVEVKRGTQRLDVRESPKSFHLHDPARNTTMLRVVCPSDATIEGRVTRPDGTPVKNAFIYIGTSMQKTKKPGSTRTDDLGDYSFQGLKPGAWRVTARDPNLTARKGAPEVRTEAAPGRVTRVDLELDFDRHWIHGQVLGEDGSPVEGLEVLATLKPSQVLLLGLDEGSLSAYTDRNGRYRIGPLPYGEVDLRVGGPGSPRNGERATLQLQELPASVAVPTYDDVERVTKVKLRAPAKGN